MNEEWKTEKKIDDDTPPFIQVRRNAGGNYLHLQVYGKGQANGNRDYGYADKFSVPPVVTQALLEYEWQGDLNMSLASPSPVYMRGLLSVHAYTDGVQLHVATPHEQNNGDGVFITDLPAQRFGQFIAFLEDNGLLINHEGEQRFVAPAQEEE